VISLISYMIIKAVFAVIERFWPECLSNRMSPCSTVTLKPLNKIIELPITSEDLDSIFKPQEIIVLRNFVFTQ